MIDASEAGKVLLALPRGKRLGALGRVLGTQAGPYDPSAAGQAELERNARLVTYIRVACYRRNEPPPWDDDREPSRSR